LGNLGFRNWIAVKAISVSIFASRFSKICTAYISGYDSPNEFGIWDLGNLGFRDWVIWIVEMGQSRNLASRFSKIRTAYISGYGSPNEFGIWISEIWDFGIG
jgi:hypothetical protein